MTFDPRAHVRMPIITTPDALSVTAGHAVRYTHSDDCICRVCAPTRQAPPARIFREPAFDAGSRDGYADAIHNAPKDPATAFAARHRNRPVEHFRAYEHAYLRTYEQVRESLERRR